MTQKMIDEAIGGVLLIDEAYSLGSAEKVDSFSKELIDTLNRNLTENAGKFVCILAGYGDQIDKCLMAHNPGLASRFRFRFKIETYEAQELSQIFELKVLEDKWSIDENIDRTEYVKFFKDNFSAFKYFGRSMITLLFYVKKEHSNRVFLMDAEFRKKITMSDIKNGFIEYKIHNNITENKEEIPFSVKHIYT